MRVTRSILQVTIGTLCTVVGCQIDVTNRLAEVDSSVSDINVSWEVGEFLIGEECFFPHAFHALKGVNVCLIVPGESEVDGGCCKTDDEGKFDMSGVPTNAELLLSFEKRGYQSRLVPLLTGEDDIEEYVDTEDNPYPKLQAPLVKISADSIEPNKENEMASIVAIALLHRHEDGIPILGEEGIVSAVGGTSINIIKKDDEDFKDKDKDKYYSDICGNPIDDLEVTAIDDGYVTFVNLSEGEYEVEFTAPDNFYCILSGVTENYPIFGFPSESSQEGRNVVVTRVWAKKNYRTITIIKCYDTTGKVGTVDTSDAGETDAGGKCECH